MKVFVVMGGDFIDKVFADEEDAEAYIKLRKEASAGAAQVGMPRIYWRAYEANVIQKGSVK